MLETFLNIITSPFIQLFILGMLAGFFKSDLEIPEAFTKALSIYLMLAIGLKGGLEINNSKTPFEDIITIIIVGVFLSFCLPFLAYFFLRKTTNLSRLDASAVSAHYGSISMVTFSFGMSYLKSKGIHFDGYVLSLAALMESPAIVSALILAKRSQRLAGDKKERLLSSKVLKEVFLNGSILLLVGGIIIGITANQNGINVVKPYLVDPFYGILCLFLLELGLVSSKQLKNISSFKPSLVLFGIYMPIISAIISLFLSDLFNFDFGNAILLSILCASASYIAVPAALKIALPEANPAYYITLSLCITFPFNLTFGVPFYHYLAEIIIK
ncbi:MAG: sodium-dependent bicarbonate transport family permease [Rickettsiales bacterium]|nr:sodium-dependent bicarbonate transport family permease [Rickettsiales bacterium]